MTRWAMAADEGDEIDFRAGPPPTDPIDGASKAVLRPTFKASPIALSNY